jgi:hypothetical protein
MKSYRLAFLVLAVCGNLNAAGSKCGFSSKNLVPSKSDKQSSFRSISGNLELTFDPENCDSCTLEIKNLNTNSNCSLPKDLWSDLYLSTDEKTLLTQRYNDLEFYDTQTCKQVGSSIPDYGGVKVEEDKITYEGVCNEGVCDGPHCNCWPARVYDLTDRCQPILNEQMSLALTKRIYGVSFSKKSLISYPKSPNAKLLKEGIE